MVTIKQRREIEKRMHTYEYAKVNGHYKVMRRTINGLVNFTKGTTKEAAVIKWAKIARLEADRVERVFGKK